MRNWIWLLAVMTLLSFGTALSAQDDVKPEKAPEGEEKEGEEAEADPLEHYKAMFKDVDAVIGKTTITEEGIKGYLDHSASFREAMKKDTKFTELKEKNLKEAFDHAVKSEHAIAWAKEKSVTLDTWLRTAVRIMVLMFRAQIASAIESGKEGQAEMRKSLAEMKADLTEEEYNEAVKQLDDGDKDIKNWEAMIDGLPKPADAETKLLEANAEKIAKVQEDAEEEEDGEDKEDSDDDMK